MNNTLSYLTARAAQLPTNEDARIKRLTATGGDRFGVIFNDNSTQELIWTIPQIPASYQGNGTLYLDIHCAMESATSGTIGIDAYLEAGDVNISSTSFDSVNTDGATVPGVAGDMFIVTIALSNFDSMVAGDVVRIKLNRNLTSYSATGDLYVLGGLLYETVNRVTLGGPLTIKSSLIIESPTMDGTHPGVIIQYKRANDQICNLFNDDGNDTNLTGLNLVETNNINFNGSYGFIGPWVANANYTSIYLNGLKANENDYNFVSSTSDSDLYINRPSGRQIRFRENNEDQITIKTGGDLETGAISSSGNISATTLTSTVEDGTAPLTITSTTVVANLNVDKLDGYDASDFVLSGNEDTNAVILTPTSSSRNVIQPSDPSYVPLTIKGNASQSANLQEWQNSSGTNLTYIDYSGNVGINGNLTVSGGVINSLAHFTTSEYIVIGSNDSFSNYRLQLLGYGGATSDANLEIGDGGSVYWRFRRGDDNLFYESASGNITTQVGNSVTRKFQATHASATPITIQGAASQTANLQEWQNNSGTVLCRVDAGGALYVNQGNIRLGEYAADINAANGYDMRLYSPGIIKIRTKVEIGTTGEIASNDVPLIVKGHTSQSANLQEWQDSDGNARAYIDPIGEFHLKDTDGTAGARLTYGYLQLRNPTYETSMTIDSSAGNIYSQFTSDYNKFRFAGSIQADAFANTDVGLTIKGSASQSANLTEWQNSSGTTLAYISKNGSAVFSPPITATTDYFKIYAYGLDTLKVYSGNGGEPYVDVEAYQFQVGGGYDNTLNIYSPAQGRTVKLHGTATFGFSEANGVDSIRVTMTKNSTHGFLLSGTQTTNQILTIKGYSGQTANLTEWQDSNSYKQLVVSKDGFLGFYENSGSNRIGQFVPNSSNGQLAYVIGNAGYPGFAIKAASSQTANLQEWQDIDSTVLSSVSSSGVISAPSFTSTVSTGTAPFTVTSTTVVTNLNADTVDGLSGSDFPILSPASSSRNVIQPTAATYIPLTVKGYTSQSANLQEWQNSSGTILSAVDSAGRFNIGNGTNAYSTSLYVNGYAQVTGRLRVGVNSSTDLDYANFGQFQMLFNSGTATCFSITQAFVATGHFGFPASSATFVLGSDGSAISFRKDPTASLGGTERFNFGLNSGTLTCLPVAASQGLIVKGAGSQTANLQEWQASDGTVLLSITSAGSFKASTFDFRRLSDNTQILNYNGNDTFSVSNSYFTCSNNAYFGHVIFDTVAGNVGIAKSSTGILKITDASSGLGSLIVGAYSASTVGLTVKGATSQSANLTEWQNSSGTVISKITSAGSLQILPAASTSVGSPALNIAETGVQSVMRYYGGLLDLAGTTTQWADWGGLNRITIGSSLTPYIGMRFDVAHKIYFGNTYLSEDFNIALTKGNHGIFSITDAAGKRGAIACGSFGGSTPAQTIIGTTNSTKLITNVALTSNVATITTSGPHTFQTGQKVVISGLTNSGLNGTYTITNIPSTTTFKFDKVASNISSVADSGYAAQTQTADLTQWKCGGSGAKFVSASSQSLSYGTNSLNADADFTVSFWMNPIAGAGGDIFFVGTTNVFDGFRISYDNTNNRINVNRASVTNYAVSSSSSIPPGVWTHVVVTYVASSGLTQVYINGATSGSTGNSTTSVGTKGYKLGYCGSNYYNGGLDAVGIWNKVLTYSDISSLFSLCKSYADLNAVELTSLHAWYDFASSSALLTDSSGNGRTLTNNGTVTADEGIPSTTTKIDSSGNLVIGAASSGAKIDVTGTDGTRFLNIADGYGTVYVQYGQVVANSFYGGGTSLFGSFNVGANADITVVRNAAGIMQIKDGSTGNGSLICGAYTSSTVALTVKGASSQSANLTEWQNSSGTALARITSSGRVSLYNGSSTYFDALYHDGSNFSCRNELTSGGSYYGNNSGSNGSPATMQAAGQNILRVYPNGIVTIASFATGSVPLSISGFSGQTGNLQEWKDSSATVLAKLNSSGAFSVHGTSSLDYTTTTAGLYFGYQGSVAPTILFANGTAAQNVRIDMVSGSLRGIIAGTSLFSMDSSTCLFTTGVLRSTGNLMALGNLSCQRAAMSTYNSLATTAHLYLDGFNGTGWGGTATADGYGIWDTVRLTDDGGTVRTAHSNEYYVATAAAASWKARVIKKVGDLTAQREYLRSESDGTYSITSIGGAAAAASTALIVTSPTATYKALTVKAASSQSANLQEWQNSSGTVLAKINSSGAMSCHTTSSLDYTTTTAGSYLGFQSSAPTILLSDGTAAKNIRLDNDTFGRFRIIKGASSLAQFGTSQIDLYYPVVGASNIQAKGNLQSYRTALQTANDLQQFASFYLDGFNGGGYGGTAPSSGFGVWGCARLTSDNGTAYLAHTQEYIAATAADASFKARVVNKVGDKDSGSGAYPHSAKEYLRAESNGTYGLTSIGGAAVIASSTLSVTSPAATYVGLTVKGATSQSANLQEWQDSSGTTLTRITSDGRISLYNGSSTYFEALYFDGSNFSCRNGLTAGGSYYGNSSGSNGSPATIQAAGQNILRVYPNGIVTIASFATGSVPLAISGFSGQTGNLQEWKDSSGTVLAKVDKDGNINVGGSTTTAGALTIHAGANIAIFETTGSGGIRINTTSSSGNPYLQFDRTGTGWMYAQLTTSTNNLDFFNNGNANVFRIGQSGSAFFANAASTIPLTVKGATSQSARLTEWQNSSGTVLAYIDSAGNLSAVTASLQASYFYDAGGLNRIAIGSTINGSSSGARFDVNHKIYFGNTYLVEDFNIALTKGNHGIFAITDYAARKGSIVCGSYGGSTPGLVVNGNSNTTKLITNVALTSNVATITTSGPHTFQTGQQVVISGLTNSGLNGTYTITNIPSTTTFKFDKIATNISSVADSGSAAQTQTADLTQWKCAGSGAKFVSASSQSLSYGTASLNADADFTVSFWFNPIAGSGADLFFVGTTNVFDGFRISYDNTNNRINVNRVGTTNYAVSASSSIASGCWNHVAVTYTASSGLTQVYINGASNGTSGSNTSSVGTKGYKLGYCGSNYFNGNMDAVGIWNKVLTYSDIASLFALNKSYTDLNSSETTLLHAWYDFNSTSTLLTDSSGNSRTLTNNGTVTADEGIPTVLTKINATGNMLFNNNLSIQMKDTNGNANVVLTCDAANNVQIRNTSLYGNAYYGISSPSNANTVYIQASGTNIFAATQSGNTLIAYNSSAIPLTVKGATSQSANLQEWQDSSGTVLAKVNKNGVVTGKTRQTFTSSSAACTYDYDVSRTQSIVLTESTTLTVSNPVDGHAALLMIEQGGSGSYTVTWPGTFVWAGGSAPTLSTTVGKVDLITFVYHSTNNKYYASATTNF